MQRDASGVDGYPVFVDDGDRGSRRGLGRGGADQDERKEESTHAVAGVFYGGMRVGSAGLFWAGKFAAGVGSQTAGQWALDLVAPRTPISFWAANVLELLQAIVQTGTMTLFANRAGWCKLRIPAQKDFFPMSLVSTRLSSHEALQLTATFAFTAERMRVQADSQTRARLYDRASRVAFLRAHIIARDEQVRPMFGQGFQRALFASA